MSKRKVRVSRTTVRRSFWGGRNVTHYRYEDPTPRPRRQGPPQDAREGGSGGGSVVRWTGRLVGVAPFDLLRLAITVAVVGLLSGQASGIAVGIVAAVVAVELVVQRRVIARRAAPPPPARPAVVPGSQWCDHCADWTVHPTDKHQPAAAA